MASETIIRINAKQTESQLWIDGRLVSRSEMSSAEGRAAFIRMAERNGYTLEYEGDKNNE